MSAPIARVYHFELNDGGSGTYRSDTAHNIEAAFDELEKVYFKRLLSVVSDDVRTYQRQGMPTSTH